MAFKSIFIISCSPVLIKRVVNCIFTFATMQTFVKVIKFCNGALYHLSFTTIKNCAVLHLFLSSIKLFRTFITMWDIVVLQQELGITNAHFSFITMWDIVVLQPLINGITDYYKILTSPRMKKIWFKFICTFDITIKVRETTLFNTYIFYHFDLAKMLDFCAKWHSIFAKHMDID